MKFVFCLWGLPSGGAVDTAWRRLATLFEVAGADVDLSISGMSIYEFSRHNWKAMRSECCIVCATVWQVLLVKLFTLGSKVKIVYWVQGLVAEEAYLKNKSLVKLQFLKVFERVSFRFSCMYIYVSPFMQDFFSKRYPLSRKKKSLIVPCLSDLSPDLNVIRPTSSFCYLGGMAAWQKFDEVVRVMNGVVAMLPGATFNIATKDLDICKEFLNRLASPELLAVTTVRSLAKKSEIETFLSAQEFGFLIRDDNSINNVASPIKLAEYLSCGVNVITTEAVKSYVDLVRDAGYVINLSKKIDSGDGRCFKYKGAKVALDVFKKNFSQDSALAAVKNFLRVP